MSRSPLLPFAPILAALALGCGGGNGVSASSSGSVPTFTFTASGLSPQSLTVANKGCVVVENADAARHDVTPDDLGSCPELIGSTTLDPKAGWDWCGFTGGPKTCRFHDGSHLAADGSPDPRFAATIVVSPP
jgi:hypothetical protein